MAEMWEGLANAREDLLQRHPEIKNRRIKTLDSTGGAQSK